MGREPRTDALPGAYPGGAAPAHDGRVGGLPPPLRAPTAPRPDRGIRLRTTRAGDPCGRRRSIGRDPSAPPWRPSGSLGTTPARPHPPRAGNVLVPVPPARSPGRGCRVPGDGRSSTGHSSEPVRPGVGADSFRDVGIGPPGPAALGRQPPTRGEPISRRIRPSPASPLGQLPLRVIAPAPASLRQPMDPAQHSPVDASASSSVAAPERPRRTPRRDDPVPAVWPVQPDRPGRLLPIVRATPSLTRPTHRPLIPWVAPSPRPFRPARAPRASRTARLPGPGGIDRKNS